MRSSLFASTVMLGSLIGGATLWAAPVGAKQPGSPAASGGMGSPAAAVEELLASVRASDPLGLLAVLHPEERYLVDTLYSNSIGSAEAAGTVDIAALLRALRVHFTTETLTAEQLTDRVAWVTTTSARLTAALDVAQLDSAVTADLSEWEQTDPYNALYNPQTDQLGIAVVNEGGQWFVSALYTAAEFARRGMELPSQLATATPASSAALTPEAAVTALADAVAAKDFNGAAAALTPLEGHLVADYQSTIGGELLEALQAYTLTVEPTHVQVIDQSADWAIVEVDQWRFGASGSSDDFPDKVDFMLTVDGLCGGVHSWDNVDEEYEDTKGCAFEEDSVFTVFELLADAGWRGPRFVVVNQGGLWSVSLIQTVLQSVAPFTTDIDSFAGIAEFAASLFIDDSDNFYPAAIAFLRAAEPALAPGTTTVAPRGGGEYGLFRVPAGVTVQVEVPPGEFEAGECFVVVLDEEIGDLAGGFGCDEQSDPISSPATMLVTTSAFAFATLAEFGAFDVTVTPA